MNENGSKIKLNMRHGFMQSIIKNQIDRDKYDKEKKAQQTAKPTSGKQKKVEQHPYVPPKKRQPPTGASSDTKLFRLDYQDEQNEIHQLHVYLDDDPHQVAEEFGEKLGFSEAMVKAFTEFLRHEMWITQQELVNAS